ncbi:hypothetical protein [uncultured Aquimarina sp.]|nr:hypothetical protein [uncultured Aquimarina sp.]
MKKSILDIKELTVLNKNQQSLLSGGSEFSSHYNCYPSLDNDAYDECYWE